MGSIDDIKSTLTQSALDALCEKFHIPDTVHLELPGRNNRIRNSPTGKISLSVIAATKQALRDRSGVLTKTLVMRLCKERSAIARLPTSLLESVVEYVTQLGVRSAFPIISVLCVYGGSEVAGRKEEGCWRAQWRNCAGSGDDDIGRMSLLRVYQWFLWFPLAVLMTWEPDPIVEAYVEGGWGWRCVGRVRRRDSVQWSSVVLISLGYLRDGHFLEFSAQTRLAGFGGAGWQRGCCFGYIAEVWATKNEKCKTEIRQQPCEGRLDALGLKLRTLWGMRREGAESSPSTAEANVVGPSQPVGAEVSSDTFYVSQEMDSETLQQTYVPKCKVINDSALDDPKFNVEVAHQACFSTEVRLRYEHNYRERKKFKRKCKRQVDLLKEKDTEIANLKAQLSLKEAKDEEAIRLSSQVDAIKGTKAAQVDELNGLNERNSAFEEEKNFAQTYFASSFEAERDRPVGQVSLLERTCYGLRDEVKKFKRKCQRQVDLLKEKDTEIANLKAQLSLKEAKDEEAIRLSSQVDAIKGIEAVWVDELNGLNERNSAFEEEKNALEHMRHLNLVKASSFEAERDRLVGQVSLLERTCSGLRDEVLGYKLFKEQIEAVQDEQVKVLSDKVAELDSDIMGMALHLDKEVYPRFLTTIARRRWILGRDLRLVVMKCLQSPEYLAALGGAIGCAIDKEANYIVVVNAFRAVDFPLLAQLESQRDATMADIMGLLHLDVHARVRRIRGDVASQRLSITDIMVPLIESLSAKNLIGEASTLGVPAVVVATTALTTFVQASSVSPIPVSDHEVADTKAQAEASSSPNIIFEQETLETSSENPAI
ncbi:hypothetical protein Tco_1571191 [Tanacetum coccineum]